MVMKARRKKKEEALQQEQISFFNQVLCSACQRLLSDALRAVVKYN